MMIKWVVVLLAVVLAACSSGQDISLATKNIAAFHTTLNAGRFTVLYDMAAPELKAASSKNDFVKIVDAVHRKLGNFQKGTTTGWNENLNTGGHFVTVTQSSQYERGQADEQFVFVVNGTAISLAGYHVNSAAMMLS